MGKVRDTLSITSKPLSPGKCSASDAAVRTRLRICHRQSDASARRVRQGSGGGVGHVATCGQDEGTEVARSQPEHEPCVGAGMISFIRLIAMRHGCNPAGSKRSAPELHITT